MQALCLTSLLASTSPLLIIRGVSVPFFPLHPLFIFSFLSLFHHLPFTVCSAKSDLVSKCHQLTHKSFPPLLFIISLSFPPSQTLRTLPPPLLQETSVAEPAPAAAAAAATDSADLLGDFGDLKKKKKTGGKKKAAFDLEAFEKEVSWTCPPPRGALEEMKMGSKRKANQVSSCFNFDFRN